MDDGARHALTDLDSHLDEIIRRLKELTRGCGTPAELTAALKRVAAIVDGLARDIDNADEKARSSVEGLRVRAVNSPTVRDPETDCVADAIRDLNARIASMSERINAPTADEPAEDWAAIRSRVDGLLAESSEAIDRRNIDAALRVLADRVENAQIQPAAPAGTTESASVKRGDQDRLSPIEHRMTSPTAAEAAAGRKPVDAPFDSATREPRPAAPPLSISVPDPAKRFVGARPADRQDAIVRLEKRVGELARTVAAAVIAARRQVSANGPAIDRLETRLVSIGERVDRLAGRTASADTILEICRRLEALCRRLVEFPAALDTLRSELADLRRDLAERDTRGFARIDEQIGALVGRFDNLSMASLGGGDDLPRSEGNGPDDGEGAAGAGRANLRGAANAADDPTEPAPDSVRQLLTGVVARLERLERDSTAETAPAKASGSFDPIPSLAWAATDGPAAGRPGPPSVPADRRPSESRMNRLNIAALRELARSSTHGQHGTSEDRKAGFIAAARRASRAGAAEPKGAASDRVESKPSAFARIGEAVRDRRWTLLVLPPVLVVVVSAAGLIGEPADTAGQPVADAIVAAGRTGPVQKTPYQDVATEPATAATEPAPVVAGPTTAIAFARPDRRGDRFAAALDAPSTIAFVRADMANMPPLDETIARPERRAAAAAGDANAAVEIAARYAEGRVVKRDLAKAAYWYERAADGGIAIAQYRLASLYERGQGVDMDRAKAAAWYRKAADLGNVGAMHNLAVMLSDGVEEGPNHAEALEYFRAAADRGVEDSQYNLGVIYARGLGVPKDFVESYKWFALAAADGDADAGANRDEIGKLLSSGERAEARRAVAAWRAHPLVAEANPRVAAPESPDAATVAAISAADRRALVRKIQMLLAEQGYDPGPADGVAGPQTQDAVRAYQRNIGLAETGKISRDLVAALVKPSR